MSHVTEGEEGGVRAWGNWGGVEGGKEERAGS